MKVPQEAHNVPMGNSDQPNTPNHPSTRAKLFSGFPNSDLGRQRRGGPSTTLKAARPYDAEQLTRIA